jgi:hypothetical protein
VLALLLTSGPASLINDFSEHKLEINNSVSVCVIS